MSKFKFAFAISRIFVLVLTAHGCSKYGSELTETVAPRSSATLSTFSQQEVKVTAGPDVTVPSPVNFVSLEGSVIDPNSQVNSVKWTQVAGPARVGITSSDQLTAFLSNLTVAGTYTFKLTAQTDKDVATALVRIILTPDPVTGLPVTKPPATIVQPSPVTQPPATTPNPIVSPVQTYSCADDIAKLGWQNLASREKVQVNFAPAGMPNYEELGFPLTYPAATSMNLKFDNPYRAGSSIYFRNTIDYSADGYRIEIKNNATNSVIAVLPSEVTNDTGITNMQGNKVSGTVRGVAPDSTGKFERDQNVNFVWFNLSLNLYQKIQNYGMSTVSLYCKDALVATGDQDIQALKRGMQVGVKRAPTTYAPGKWGYVLDPATPSLPASVQCPLEVEAGAAATCSVDSLDLVSGTWYVDGVAVRNFTAPAAVPGYGASDSYTVSKNGAANHQVRVLVKYKDGSTELRDLYLIKFK